MDLWMKIHGVTMSVVHITIILRFWRHARKIYYSIQQPFCSLIILHTIRQRVETKIGLTSLSDLGVDWAGWTGLWNVTSLLLQNLAPQVTGYGIFLLYNCWDIRLAWPDYKISKTNITIRICSSIVKFKYIKVSYLQNLVTTQLQCQACLCLTIFIDTTIQICFMKVLWFQFRGRSIISRFTLEMCI